MAIRFQIGLPFQIASPKALRKIDIPICSALPMSEDEGRSVFQSLRQSGDWGTTLK
jgi:hypothetical protein